MHIPDGILSPPVWATLNLTTVPVIGLAARRAGVHAEDARVPLMGVLGAFVFAAQMVNFPVAFGTSGHLIGGTLLACTAGPAAATLIMAAILVVQALLFQDGGVLALGANVMSMAVLGVMAGYLPFRLWGAGSLRRAAIFIGGFLSVAASAASALAFLYLSGIQMPRALLGIPVATFAVNAVLEGAITVAVIEAIERMNPAWVRLPARSQRKPALALTCAAVLLAGGGFVFASSAPDGLERLNQSLGFAEGAESSFATPLGAVIGLTLVYVACVCALRLIGKRRPVLNERQSGD